VPYIHLRRNVRDHQATTDRQERMAGSVIVPVHSPVRPFTVVVAAS